MVPTVTPQLVGNDGLRALRMAITEPDSYACEPKGRRRARPRGLPAGRLDRDTEPGNRLQA
jgi:hypothetical protein